MAVNVGVTGHGFQSDHSVPLRLTSRNCECDVPLRRQFRRVDHLRIEIKRGACLGVTKQTLNRLYVSTVPISVDRPIREHSEILPVARRVACLEDILWYL